MAGMNLGLNDIPERPENRPRTEQMEQFVSARDEVTNVEIERQDVDDIDLSQVYKSD